MSFEDSRTTNTVRPQAGGAANLASQTAQGRVDTLRSDVGNALERGRSGIADSAQTAGTDLASDVSKLSADIASSSAPADWKRSAGDLASKRSSRSL